MIVQKLTSGWGLGLGVGVPRSLSALSISSDLAKDCLILAISADISMHDEFRAALLKAVCILLDASWSSNSWKCNLYNARPRSKSNSSRAPSLVEIDVTCWESQFATCKACNFAVARNASIHCFTTNKLSWNLCFYSFNRSTMYLKKKKLYLISVIFTIEKRFQMFLHFKKPESQTFVQSLSVESLCWEPNDRWIGSGDQ